MKTAVVTGAGGQDGWYLSKFLLSKNYKVYGLLRPGSVVEIEDDNFTAIHGSILDPRIVQSLAELKTDEFYHLAALQNVFESFGTPDIYLKTNTLSTVNLIIQLMQYNPSVRFFYPSSCVIGDLSPYAASKAAAHTICESYRDRGFWCAVGVLYNHESPRRADHFVTQQICKGLVRFKTTGEPVFIRDLSAVIDWHHAADTVVGMWLSLQSDKPATWTFASGQGHTIYDWARISCRWFGIDINEAIKTVQSFDSSITRVGQPSSGWTRFYSFESLIHEMCESAERTKF